MGRISTYERDGVITDNDRLLGSNYINGTYNTANYKISDLINSGKA